MQENFEAEVEKGFDAMVALTCAEMSSKTNHSD